MEKLISVIIPNYNGESTIGTCLKAVFSSDHDNFEVIVVDDCSTDDSAEIIRKFPCIFIQSDKHSGASRARNIGAGSSNGRILFFIDADCIVQQDTLSLVNKAFEKNPDKVIGGTYTRISYDDVFYSTFQSVFVNYSETKKQEPDYIATHAMVIASSVFKESGGFPEDFLPIIEDVEFSHRLRRSGYKLIMHPEIQVQHIFNFTLIKSLKNAFRKSKYWVVYSLSNKDIFSDSGTASVELKVNVASWFFNLLFMVLYFLFKLPVFPVLFCIITIANLVLSRSLIKSFFDVKGFSFSVMASLYYLLAYPVPVGLGSLGGLFEYYSGSNKKRF